MTITRLALETALIDRTSGLLALVGKDTTANGENPDLTNAIGFAMTKFGGTVATPGDVTDTDLLSIADSLFYSLVDLGEYRLIADAVSNYTEPDQANSMNRQDLGKMMQRYQDRLKELTTLYGGLLKIRLSPTFVGRIKTHFPSPHRRDWGIGRGWSDH